MSAEYELIGRSRLTTRRSRARVSSTSASRTSSASATSSESAGSSQPKTGSHYLPVLVCPDGEVVQDSITIVETLEARHPARPVIPDDPVLAFVTYVFDTLSDEFFNVTGASQRWATEEAREWGFRLFRHTVGNDLANPDSASGGRADGREQRSQEHQLASRVRLQARYPDLAAACVRFSEGLYDRLEAHLKQTAVPAGRPAVPRRPGDDEHDVRAHLPGPRARRPSTCGATASGSRTGWTGCTPRPGPRTRVSSGCRTTIGEVLAYAGECLCRSTS